MSGALRTEVAIVGGGTAGCSAALHLARRGVPCMLFERRLAGSQASGVNFGGVRQNFRALPEVPLARRARGFWDRLTELVGHDGEFDATGHLRLAFSAEDMATLEAWSGEARQAGLATELIGTNRLRRDWPWYGPDVIGGLLCPDDGQANPRIVAPAFCRAARRAGAVVRETTEIVAGRHDGELFRLQTAAGEEIVSRVLLNVAGAWANTVAGWFGESAPMRTIAPQMVVTEPVPYRITVNMGGAGLYLRQTRRGNVVFGTGDGVADLESVRHHVLPERTVDAARLAARIVPHVADAHIIRTWSGIEGETADLMPVIGPSRTTAGLFHAYGFSGHGFQLGPMIGELLAELATTGATASPIAPFAIDRFAAAS